MRDRSDSEAEGEIEVTPEMIEAGMSVDWVRDYQFEFGVNDEDMVGALRALWVAMAQARGR